MPRKPEPTRIVPPYSETISGEDHSLLINLDADDHPQYHNDARALTWLNTLIGVSVQAFDQALQDIADVTATTGDLLRWNGVNWAVYPDSNFAASGHNHDHNTLTTLGWSSSGHTGTVSYVAGFDGSGNAVDIDPSTFAGVTDHTGLSNLAWTASGHTGTANHVPYFSGAGAASSSASFTWDGTALLTPELEISATAEGILFTDTSVTGKFINFNTGGFGVPTFTSRSAGTRLILWPNLSASSGDWAIGLESGHTWFSTPQAVNTQGFIWYGGTTEVMQLGSDGALSLEGVFTLAEQASVTAPAGGYGKLWVKNDTPNTLYFTDDGGTDHLLAYSNADHALLTNLAWTSSGHTGTANAIPYFNGAGAASADSGLTWSSGNLTLSDATDPKITLQETGSAGFEWYDATDNAGLLRKRATTGSPTLHLDSYAEDGTSAANIYMFQFSTITTGDTQFYIYDSSGTINHRFRGTGHTILAANSGNVGVGGAGTPQEQLDVSGGMRGQYLIVEEAAAAPTVGAGLGGYWVKNDIPSTPYYTDDAGTDHQLAYTSGAGVDHSGLSNLAWTSSGHTGTANHIPYFSGAGAAASNANITTDGTTISLDGTGAPLISMTNTAATGKWIFMDTGGSAAPTFTTRSAGTKFVLWNQLSGTQTDFAMGMESGYMWFSAGNNTGAQGFKWYGKTTEYARLTVGSGTFALYSIEGAVQMAEQASIASPAAGYGRFWVKNDAPNTPMYTDDAGTDHSLYDIVYDTSPQLGGNLDANGKAITYDLNTLTSSAAITIDWNLGNKATVTLAHSPTFTFTAPTTGACSLQLVMKQDAIGSRVPTWPATVKWAGGTEPTWSTGANAIDIVSFLYDGTNYYGSGGTAFA